MVLCGKFSSDCNFAFHCPGMIFFVSKLSLHIVIDLFACIVIFFRLLNGGSTWFFIISVLPKYFGRISAYWL